MVCVSGLCSSLWTLAGSCCESSRRRCWSESPLQSWLNSIPVTRVIKLQVSRDYKIILLNFLGNILELNFHLRCQKVYIVRYSPFLIKTSVYFYIFVPDGPMIHRGFFIEALLGTVSLFFLNYSVLRIRDILVQIRIQILGSVPWRTESDPGVP